MCILHSSMVEPDPLVKIKKGRDPGDVQFKQLDVAEIAGCFVCCKAPTGRREKFTIKESAYLLLKQLMAAQRQFSVAQRGAEIRKSAKSDEDATADYEHEKDELRMWLTVVPGEKETMDPEILSVEKRYPLIKEMLKKMLNWKLEAEAESTMAFELLKFIVKSS
ncbi:hypothetical protein Tco_0217761 [Tanacetum coccineum]